MDDILSYLIICSSIGISITGLFFGLAAKYNVCFACGLLAGILSFLSEGLFFIVALSFAFLPLGLSFIESNHEKNMLSRSHIKGPIIPFIVLVLVLIFVGMHLHYPIIQSIEKETSYESLILSNDPVIRDADFLTSQGFGITPLFIVINGEIMNVETWKYIDSIGKKLREKEDRMYITNVMSVIDISFPDGNIPDSEDELRTTIYNFQEDIKEHFISKDFKTTVIYVTTRAGGTPKESEEIKKRVCEVIDNIKKPVSVDNVLVTGMPMMSQSLDKSISFAQIVVTVLSVGFLFFYVSLSMFWREKINVRSSISSGILLSLAFTVLATFDIMYVQKRMISIATPVLLTLIFGVGIDDSLHLLGRFRTEKEKNSKRFGNREKAIDYSIRKAIAHTAAPAFATTATTILALCTLILVPIPMLREFAPVGIVSMLITFIDSMVIFPYFIKLSELYPKVIPVLNCIVSIIAFYMFLKLSLLS